MKIGQLSNKPLRHKAALNSTPECLDMLRIPLEAQKLSQGLKNIIGLSQGLSFLYENWPTFK